MALAKYRIAHIMVLTLPRVVSGNVNRSPASEIFKICLLQRRQHLLRRYGFGLVERATGDVATFREKQSVRDTADSVSQAMELPSRHEKPGGFFNQSSLRTVASHSNFFFKSDSLVQSSLVNRQLQIERKTVLARLQMHGYYWYSPPRKRALFWT